MIQSFGDRQTERLFAREPVPSLDPRIARVALRKLYQIDAACRLEDLRIPPGNRLERKIAPIHPGEVLMEDFIEGFGITQHKLAVAIGVPPRRINEIVHGKRGITADTAMRLSRYFGTTPGFWMNLQMRYELDRAEDVLGDTLSGIVPLMTVEVA